MRLGGRLFFITIIYCSALLCESTSRHLLSLFGIRFSERNGFRNRPFWYSPVIILPSFSQKQNVVIESSNADENYQENGDVFQRLTSETDDYNTATTSEYFDNIIFNDLKNKEIFKDSETIEAEETIDNSLRSGDNVTDVTLSNTTEEIVLAATVITTTQKTTTTEPVTESQSQTTTDPKAPYSSPLYNNEFINNLTFTTPPIEVNIESMLTLPKSNDNFNNFITSSEDNSELYNGNGFLLPTNDDRWRQFSTPASYISNQFRPIAGLYHDGFLHRPLPIREGFVPSRQLYY